MPNETQSLWERNQLVLFLAALYPSWLEPYPAPADMIYRCVIEMPVGIMAWEIEPRHLRYFDHIERKPEPTGLLLTQTKSEMYTLLRQMPQQWSVEKTILIEDDENQMDLLENN